MDYHTQKFVSYCQEFLVTEFKRRQERNPTYSIRAFSRDLGVPKTSISEVMNGLRCLSQANVDLLAQGLDLDQKIIDRLKADLSIDSDRGRDLLGEEDFSLIKDWHYMAILSLAKLSHNECSAGWISERLGIPLDLAQSSLNRLLQLGLIKEEQGKLVRTAMPLTTSVDIPSSSIREHHRQSIEKAIPALENVPVELRDFTTVTYVINPKNLPEIKKMIHTFHRKLGKTIPEKEATEVYRLNIQFFPLTKIEPIETTV
jgi:predicted transcriptional regulator/plasmid maintenance system antidote protein VapI